ncbi:DNA repair protein XRCC2 homolog isoform X1 [Ricinus communis]|uniref:DNA repair protein XRCC2 homolog isoform X1 n=1 Tax=Ricinus communis TaxID=3988 RepID=UPI0007724FDF|nr:DNA repair protein XRCC2 homolog isoform X1 [Ricinus communis]|eukprot:XP_015572745.1 DNA repair protein XRCC2 homolog [Ricinus communis]
MSNGIRGWIEGDESGREMLSRVQKERPYLHLPPPFHKVPIRVGNVIEVIGSSPSAKTHILMQSATHCILPQYCGGLGRLVFFVDLDCRFDILRLSQILKNRIIQTNGSDDEEIFGACMRRFRYIRCYDSLEFLATLKTLRHQIQRDREAQGITISCMMIDSIGAFHWVDRASTSFLGDNSRKGFSLQNVWETIVQEIKKLLLVHPMLVIAAKATILGNRYAANNIKWNLKRPCSPGSAVSSVSNKLVHREYMSSVWQSFVTLRILVQATDDHISIDRNHNKSVYLSEWLLPSQSYVDKFIVEDAGVFCVS